MASIQDNGGYLCKTTVNTSDDCVEFLLVGIASFLALKKNKKNGQQSLTHCMGHE